MNIKNGKNLIMTILDTFPSARDDDNILIAKFWEAEFDILAWDIEHFTATNFLNMLADSDFSKPEAITRCRRKLQELHPELRGQKYYQRHQHQTEVIDQVRNF